MAGKKTSGALINGLLVIVTIIGLVLSSWLIVEGDITFHTDIARDFLLLEDMWENKNLTLIGPRSGGIPGVFHGPLWIYMNLPAYVAGDGDPVAVGWLWVGLAAAGIGILYYSTRKLFDKRSALIAAALYSTYLYTSIRELFNPFGAVMFAPLFFLFVIYYIRKRKLRDLAISVFLLGILIQFQVAFGAPLLLLMLVLFVPLIIKDKKYSHLLAFLVILIPLSSHVLFELRNNFLETRSLITYVSGGETALKSSFGERIETRMRGMFLEGWNLFPGHLKWFMIPLIMAVGFRVYEDFKKKKMKNLDIFFLFTYFYVGFWSLTMLFSGKIWGYYHWPFLPLAIMILVAAASRMNKKIFYGIVIALLFMNLQSAFKDAKGAQGFVGSNGGSWQFHHNVAKTLFNDSQGEEFGYYIFSPDLFGYSSRYGMNYAQKQYPNIIAHPFTKKRLTYLIISPAPGNRPDLNGEGWKEGDLYIKREPDEIILLDSGYHIEKYILDEEEIAAGSNPNLIQDLHFR